MKTFYILLLVSLLIISKSKESNEEDPKTIMNCYYSKTSGKYFTEVSSEIDREAVASATYINSYETKGWDFLTISSYDKSDNKYPDDVKSYAMGYLEGILNQKRIFQIYRNLLYFSFYDNNNKLTEKGYRLFDKKLRIYENKII